MDRRRRGYDSSFTHLPVRRTRLWQAEGQNLSLHPHLHCLIPNGAWDPARRCWIYPKKKHFLFPVRVMSKMFRGEFIRLVNKEYQGNSIIWAHKDWMALNEQIRNSGFNVFSKLSYAGPSQIIQYLARYSHRVAITNSRIVDVTEQQVTFKYRDYRDGKNKVLGLSPSQFVLRFLLHVLPKGFCKIRHFGILSNRSRGAKIPEILYFFERRVPESKQVKVVDRLRSLIGESFDQCPACGTGRLIIQNLTVRQQPIRGDPLIPVPPNP